MSDSRDTIASLVGTDHAALERGHITSKPIRSRPKLPSWALKVAMAVTGTIFALFVLVHMIGNLKVYSGADSFNAYAHWLRNAFYPLLPHEGLLWIMRIALAASLIIHVVAAIMLTVRSRKSRGKFAAKSTTMRAYSARNMLISGFILLGFIIFHILDLTVGAAVAPEEFIAASTDQSFAYQNLVASFQRPLAAAVYIVTLLALALHLAHGLWVVVNDLGGTGKRIQRAGAIIGGAVALAVLVGNISIPICVLLGVVS